MRRPIGPRIGENPRPPRYRLLAAAAALPQRETVYPHESFDAECPACGRTVKYSQVAGADGIEYTIDEHDGCR